jgi:hypothetical protein
MKLLGLWIYIPLRDHQSPLCFVKKRISHSEGNLESHTSLQDGVNYETESSPEILKIM